MFCERTRLWYFSQNYTILFRRWTAIIFSEKFCFVHSYRLHKQQDDLFDLTTTSTFLSWQTGFAQVFTRRVSFCSWLPTQSDIMATAKFKDVSPYVHNSERQHHSSDWKYDKYLKSIVINHWSHIKFPFFRSYLKGLAFADSGNKAADGKDQKPITLGLFGLGRAGSIHLNNILANPQIQLKYIVEDDDSKWASVTKKLNLKGITFLRSTEAKKLYDDKSLEAVIVATPTYSHEQFIADRFATTHSSQNLWLTYNE